LKLADGAVLVFRYSVGDILSQNDHGSGLPIIEIDRRLQKTLGRIPSFGFFLRNTCEVHAGSEYQQWTANRFSQARTVK
jgi:hypothetical protein